MRVRAPAKVNLTLRVLGRRPSGYHDIETLFQAVDLCDELVVAKATQPGVEVVVHGADVGPLADNLVTRAARAVLAAGGLSEGVAIALEKRIPAGAGLGGGSSDAGATLRALNELFPGVVSPAGLLAIAGSLGSDVPFFVGTEGLARGQGRGEVLTPLPALPPAYVVLGLPPVQVATAAAYGALARAREAKGASVDAAPRPSGGAGSWPDIARSATNDFEPVIAAAHPPVARALSALRATHPLFALLSGSGAAVFGVYVDAREADAARSAAADACPDVTFRTVTTLEALPGLNPAGSPV